MLEFFFLLFHITFISISYFKNIFYDYLKLNNYLFIELYRIINLCLKKIMLCWKEKKKRLISAKPNLYRLIYLDLFLN